MSDDQDRPTRDRRPPRKGARPFAGKERNGGPKGGFAKPKRPFGAGRDDGARDGGGRDGAPRGGWKKPGGRGPSDAGRQGEEAGPRKSGPRRFDGPRDRSGEGREGGAKRFDKPKTGGRWPREDRQAPRDAAAKPAWKRDRDTGDAQRGEKRPFVKGDRANAGSAPRSAPSFNRPARHGGERPGEGRAPARETGERIAKRLARAGVSSRRDAEALIADGRVSVNGRVLDTPALNVGPGDTILIDGKPLPPIERTRLFLFHKPAGVVTTNRDPEGRKTIFDVLPAELPRLMTVGRLDINTEGLLLLTNDGGLARTLELPATGWLRRYRVRVHGKVDEKRLAELKDGVAVDGVFYGAVEASLDREQGSNAWLTIGLREGKNREVKNILGSLGLEVTRLIRVSFGPFQLGELAEGAVQELRGRTLREQLGERLIEESGADFDAPIEKPFSNKAVVGGMARDERPAPRRDRDEPGEGGLIKNRKRERERHREEALDRLQTARPSRGDKAQKTRHRDERPAEPQRSRSSNVWMAPGARPQGKKKDTPPRSPTPGGRGAGQGGRGPKNADRRR